MPSLAIDTGHGGNCVLVTFDDRTQVTLSPQAGVRAREIVAAGGGDAELRDYVANIGSYGSDESLVN